MIKELSAELQGYLRTVTGLDAYTEDVQSVYDLNDFIDSSVGRNAILAGVQYAGLQNNDPSSGRRNNCSKSVLSSTIFFDVLLVIQHNIIGDNSSNDSQLDILDEARGAVLGQQSAETGGFWSLVQELKVDLADETAISVYVQRWSIISKSLSNTGM